jgi:hypothetical protein
MERSVIGVISEQLSDGGLASAAARQPGWTVRAVPDDEYASDGLAALVVDVPPRGRAAVLERLSARRWHIPILIEGPVIVHPDRTDLVENLGLADLVVAANPLRYALHTRRLLEELTRTDAPQSLHTFFAAWRFRPESTTEHALPQLLDYLGGMCPEAPLRVSAMQDVRKSVVIVTLRYASDVLGSIEVGRHLPASFPSESELVVECFCETSAYACEPGRQAVEVYGRDRGAFSWQPSAAEAIANAFAGWLRGAPRPHGSIANDVATLRLVDRIGQALQASSVLEGARPPDRGASGSAS